MGSLRKLSAVSNNTAGLIIFVAWYVSAVLTTVIVAGTYERLAGLFLLTFLSVLGFMTVVFAVAWKIKRTDIVDMAWGPAFIVAAVTSLLLNEYQVSLGLNVQTLVTALVTVWGLRLAYVIFKRLRAHPEDKRYVELRSKWKGSLAFNTYVRIFVVQALLATVISTAVIHTNVSLASSISWLAYAGLAIWLIGFVFEAVGDFQLKRFLGDPRNKGKLMTQGLWKYTRHPNYFGEATMWWGIFVIGLSVPYGWLGIITPVVITYLLLFVSGVPMTEKSFEGRPGWKAYKASVSKFFPLPPR